MDTKTRTTKQGLRDLNFYGSRKKAAEAGAEGAPAGAVSGALAPVDATLESTTTVPTTTVASSGPDR